MDDKNFQTDLIWKFYEEQRDSAKKQDQQRTSISNFIVASTGVLLAVNSKTDDYYIALLMSLFISILGIYGVFVVRKLHERAEYYRERARVALKKIEQNIDSSIFNQIIDQAYLKHKQKFSINYKLGLHKAWALIHFFIFLLGIVLNYIIIFKYDLL